jgi:patatin-like phospholipase
MVDTPDRSDVRFPPDQVARVTSEIRAALDAWAVGPETTVVTGGANGTDIIVAEECLARGARALVCLALPPDEFESRSVAGRDGEWTGRFRSLLERAEVRTLPDPPSGDELYAATNCWIVETARSLDGDQPHALLVWNGKEGDGPGGTRDFVRLLGLSGPAPNVRVIDPTPRAYEARQAADGPKRLLALDGGGIRGVLTLSILRSLEEHLQQRHGDDLVLAGYFDYIAGTSTGAIIATALALGKPVSEVQEMYRNLSGKIFSKRFLPLRLRSIYRDGPLARELESFFGEGRTLGDPELRSLLLMVLHNTGTDSPWLMSNCTRAKYNRADRYLKTPPDRNLDLQLSPLVRASAAAPVFFPPQELCIGSNTFVFQDGGITPYNNPALILFLLATLPEYGLGWPAGADKLLLVSVGTGSSAAVHPNLLAREVNLVFNAKNLSSVFMNGASMVQDMLCRSLARTSAGAEIDREFGSRVGIDGVGGQSLFTYARYNADLSEAGLLAQGITDESLRRSLRKLDRVDRIPDLEALGSSIGEAADFDHDLAGFGVR